MMRVPLALLAAAATAALGALILGEYDLRGAGAVVSGCLFGLAVAEVAVLTGGNDVRSARTVPAVVTAALAAAALVWAGWISVRHRSEPIPADYWAAAVAAAAVAAFRIRSAARR